MAPSTLLTKRFKELDEQMGKVGATKRYENSEYFPGDVIDDEAFLNWRVKVRNLLAMACGQASEHLKQFAMSEQPKGYSKNFESFKELRAIFLAAKEDYEGGYLISVRNLVQAEVYSDELEQAEGLLKGGHKVASAVIAGVVLETALRQLSNDAGLPVGNINRMNSELAKADVYNALMMKQITAWADIRNNAAHGHADQFSDAQVSSMIAAIRGFLADRL